MKCSYCNNDVNEYDKFCRECGAPIEKKINKEESKNAKNKTEIKQVSNENQNNSMVQNKSKGQAIASMVLGIISFIFGFFLVPLPIVGLILGLTYKGKCGEKTAGIILNSISLGFIILFWCIIIIGVSLFRTEVSDHDNSYPVHNSSEFEDNIIDDDFIETDFDDFFEQFKR